eukprot:g8220.t1
MTVQYDFERDWKARRFEVDTGFNRETFDSVLMGRAIVAFWLRFEVQLPQCGIKQAAHTAGGEVFIDGTVKVTFRNEPMQISGVTSPRALCHGVRIELTDEKYYMPLLSGVTEDFAVRVREIAKAHRDWSLEQVVYAADPEWHRGELPLTAEEQLLFRENAKDGSTTVVNKATVTVEEQVANDRFDLKFPDCEAEPPTLVHGYRRILYGVSRLPASRMGKFPDSRAVTRVTRDLDQPFGEFREIDYGFQSKNNFLVNRPLDRVRSIVVDYFFDREEANSKPVAPPFLFDLPITEEYFEPPLNERFYVMLRPPMSYSGVRLVSLQRGDEVPGTLSQKYKLHKVPEEFYKSPPSGNGDELLPSPLKEFEGKWSGVAKCVVDRVRAVPAYESFRREIEKTISTKGMIAIVVGDGLLDNVAIVESLKDKVHKNRIRHCSLTWSADLQLKRITCTGELVPYGVTERTDAELKFDFVNRCCRKDPRFGLSRKQLVAFGIAKAVARRTGERGMTKTELVLECAKKLRRFRYEDLEKACEAVMLTSTRHFRYSANPLRMIRGTWLGVDVRAVAKLDTTFLTEPWSDVGLAVVNVINCFDKQAYGELVGPKKVMIKDMNAETRKAVDAVMPGVDPSVGHPTGADVTRVASMAMLLQIVVQLLVVDLGPENIVRALALLMLGAGLRLRITSGNSARMMAMIERLQLTIKTQLESYRHDPYLAKLQLAAQVILCHMVRNERIRQSLRRSVEPASHAVELLTELDLPYLPTLLEQLERGEHVARVTGPFVLKICSDCGERRAVHPKYAKMSQMIRCRDFRDVICGDISDDVLEANSGWVPPRVPRANYSPSKWLVPISADEGPEQAAEERRRVQFNDQPLVKEYDPAAVDADPMPNHDVEWEDGDLLADEILPGELEPAEDAAEENDLGPVEIAAVEVDKAGSSPHQMPEPNVFNLSVVELEEILDSQEVRVNQVQLQNNENVAKLATAEPLTFRDERVDWEDATINEAKAAEGNKPFERFRNWIVDDSIFAPSFHSREADPLAGAIVSEYEGTGGPNVEDDSWALFVTCIKEERCWYLDNVTTVWGESEVKRLSPTNVVGDHPERKAFVAYVHKIGENHFCWSRSSASAYGAVRFELDGREAVCGDSASERLLSMHRPGFTAGMRKKLRKGNKLPDYVPEDLVKGKLDLREFMVYALVKELRGTITGTSSEGVPCVVIAGDKENAAEAAGVLHSGDKPLTSRFLFDVKYFSIVFVILKCRWAPGGHMSSKERLELSENGSPTPVSVEMKIALFSGNAMRVPRPLKTDVPRAFNDSIQYALEERPRATITRRGPILDDVIEEATRRFEEQEGIYIGWDSIFVMNIAQCGSLEGAVVFWLSNRYKCRKSQIMPSLSSPCIFRIHDEQGQLLAVLLEFVDDFLGVVEGAVWDWLVNKMITIYPRLEPEMIEPITNEPSTVIGREVSFHVVPADKSPDGRPEVYLQVDCRNKIGALGKWESDDEMAKRKGDLDRLLTRAEVERLRSVRGECLYVVTDWRPDCVYAQKVVNFGSDESRTVRHAARQNLVVDLLKQHQLLGIRFRLDLGISELVFILLVDAGFQARPHKEKTSKDAPDAKLRNRGVMELLQKDSQEYSNAKLTNMRALTAYGLFVTSEAEFRKSATDKTPMRGTLLGHGLEHSDDIATSSGSAEMGGYLRGIENTEITKRKLQDVVNTDAWAGVERRQKKEDLTWDDEPESAEALLSGDPGLILDLAKATELDLLDSEVVIRRTLSRTISIKGEFRNSMRRMMHITDIMNTMDVFTKYQPADNVKMHYLREMMEGRFHWYRPGDKKQADKGGVFGVLRENTREDGADPRARKPALVGMK